MERLKNKWLIPLIACILLLVGCSSETTKDEPIELTISAAVSLTDALEEMQEMYENEHNIKLTFNLAGSGTLAQQIQQGAPIDLFISANQNWMDTLENDNMIDSSTREDMTGNNLVLITHKDSSLSYQSFEEISAEDVDEIAVGNPESVPAGGYTKDTLTSLGMWESLEDLIILAKDVRQVLTYVETGNADIGFVYESDALTSENIQIVAKAEEGLHEPIVYPVAITNDSKYPEEAQAFLDYMLSEEGQDILAKHGFKK